MARFGISLFACSGMALGPAGRSPDGGRASPAQRTLIQYLMRSIDFQGPLERTMNRIFGTHFDVGNKSAHVRVILEHD